MRFAGFLMFAVTLGWLAGCDSGGGGASPKVENTKNVQLKSLAKPGSPAGGGGGAAPGGGAKSD